MVSHWKFTDRLAGVAYKAKPLDGEDSEFPSPLAAPCAMFRGTEGPPPGKRGSHHLTLRRDSG